MTDTRRRLEIGAAVMQMAWDCERLSLRVEQLETVNLELQRRLDAALAPKLEDGGKAEYKAAP